MSAMMTHAFMQVLPSVNSIAKKSKSNNMHQTEMSSINNIQQQPNNLAQKAFDQKLKDEILSFISSDDIFPQNVDDIPNFIMDESRTKKQAKHPPAINSANARKQSVVIQTNSMNTPKAKAFKHDPNVSQKLLTAHDALLRRKGPLDRQTIEVLKDMIRSFNLDRETSIEHYTTVKNALEELLKRKKEMPHTSKSIDELLKHDLIIFQTLGFLYVELEAFHEAKEMYLDVIYEIQSVTIGPTHPDTLRTLSDIANLFSILGDYDNARKYYLTCYVEQKKAFGVVHEDTISTLQHLSNMYLLSGKFDQAKFVGEKCFKTIITSGDTKTIQPSTAFTTLHNLALLHQHSGDYDKSQKMFERALSQQLRVLGRMDEDTILTMHNLSTLYHDMQNYNMAIRTGQECFILRKEVMGLDDPDTLVTLCNLGVMYQRQGENAKAKRIFDSCLNLQRSILGENHEDTFLTKQALAEVNSILGEMPSVLPVVEKKVTSVNVPTELKGPDANAAPGMTKRKVRRKKLNWNNDTLRPSK
jgi:tetratricopeptide (TPR) repeat protein